MSLRDDLIAAKALIDTPEKWRKDDSDDYDGCCAIVAANRVSGSRRYDPDNPRQSRMWQAFYAELPEAYRQSSGASGAFIGDFNDHPDTTHADIMALFDRAIEAAA